MHIASLAGAALLVAGSVLADEAPPSDCLNDTPLTPPVMILQVGEQAVLTDRHFSAILDGILLPGAKFDHNPRFVAPARASLARLTGAPPALWSVGPDRYGRIRVQAAAAGVWVQGEMVARGLARADPGYGSLCVAQLYALETLARSARRGLWADPAYAIRTPVTVAAGIGSFQIVEGRVLSATKKDGRVFLNFGADWKTDFTVTIAPADAKRFRRARLDLLSLTGQRVRVRGLVQSYHGPEIVLAGPEGLELLP